MKQSQTRAVVDAMHEKFLLALPMIDRVEVCFHAGAGQGEPCMCRKPQPGMLLAAAAALQIDLRRSYLIGDRWRDVDCAKAQNAAPSLSTAVMASRFEKRRMRLSTSLRRQGR